METFSRWDQSVLHCSPARPVLTRGPVLTGAPRSLRLYTLRMDISTRFHIRVLDSTPLLSDSGLDSVACWGSMGGVSHHALR